MQRCILRCILRVILRCMSRFGRFRGGGIGGGIHVFLTAFPPPGAPFPSPSKARKRGFRARGSLFLQPPDRLRKRRAEGVGGGTKIHTKSANSSTNSSTKSSTHKIHRARPESGGGIRCILRCILRFILRF